MGKALVLFWGGILTIGSALALTIHHFAPSPQAELHHIPPPNTQPPQPHIAASSALPLTAATVASSAILPTPPPKNKPIPPLSPLEAAAQAHRIPLAIMLAGYGYSAQLSHEALLTLPAPVAFSISPYLTSLPALIPPSRAAQHEVYMSLPMRSIDPDHTDTGSQTLGTGESPAHEQQKLSWWLSRSQNITGMTDVTGAGCTQTDNTYLQSQEFHDIAETITRHGLLYFNGDSTSERPTRGITATQCLNGDTTPEELTQSLNSLTPSTQAHGAIILVITPLTPAALHSLTAWLHSASAAHFYLTPPSALADTPPLSTH
ncbi:divergent polysaccharide deacetylase family protein [Neokomagataea thailandica]|uniref:Divergent polysaccharide deacetylase n=1 Tax=Neokomagataea tanensis NBRC 106556 TaxID=1223519 RepID=A0ABQ0QHM0_9PROT|nr:MULTISPECIES: divergent polysaccharide deacetylase family protein [Neokomagataea]GBR45112.1 hypothetical protein AA106556_0656 [Neokomagataea tanensis NBRC 106556]